MSYWMRLLIAIDQLANVLLLDGSPDETVSARAWRRNWVVTIAVLNRMFFWQDNHCRECYEWERDRYDLPKDYRN